jgi:hypothetical protein
VLVFVCSGSLQRPLAVGAKCYFVVGIAAELKRTNFSQSIEPLFLQNVPVNSLVNLLI